MKYKPKIISIPEASLSLSTETLSSSAWHGKIHREEFGFELRLKRVKGKSVGLFVIHVDLESIQR